VQNDGALEPPTSGEAIPNPDPRTLLKQGSYVLHPERSLRGGTLQLNGGVHYFPNGITFENGYKIEGSGTIVSDNGHDVVFETPLGSNSAPARINVLSLDGARGTGSGGSIHFKNGTFLSGLIYAHENVTFNSNWRVLGSIVTYRGDIVADANVHFILDRIAVPVAGFESWLLGASQFGGPVTLRVISWQGGL
jgi:hypothetical protein